MNSITVRAFDTLSASRPLELGGSSRNLISSRPWVQIPPGALTTPFRTYPGTPRPRGAGQLPQPGCLQPATNFQNALFTNIEVGHWLILSEGAQGIDRVSGGCEHLLAEGVRHWASVSAACVAITGGLFCMGWPTLPGYLPLPKDPGTVSGFTPVGQAS